MERKFPQGIRAFKPSDKAPDFILADLVIAPDLFNQFINDNPDNISHWNGEKQIKLQILKGKDGKSFSIQVNNYKPGPKKNDSDLPF